MSAANKIIGASIAMSRREPYVMKDWNPSENWKFTVLGYFDELRIDIVDNPNDFTLKHLYDELANSDLSERKLFHSETQKIFLWREYSSTCVGGDKLRDIIKDYRSNKGRPFVALFAVKLRRRFTDGREGCNECACIEKHLRLNPKPDCDAIALYSLSIDDVYVLVTANSPAHILEMLHDLQSFACNFKCPSNMSQNVTIRSIATNLEKRLKVLKHDAENELDDTNDRQKSVSDAFKALEKHCDKLITVAESNDTSVDYAHVEVGAKILNDFFTTHSSYKFEFEELNLLTRYLDALREISNLPNLLLTHSIFGFHDGVVQDMMNASDNFDTNSFMAELEINLSPGVDMNEFNHEFARALILQL